MNVGKALQKMLIELAPQLMSEEVKRVYDRVLKRNAALEEARQRYYDRYLESLVRLKAVKTQQEHLLRDLDDHAFDMNQEVSACEKEADDLKLLLYAARGLLIRALLSARPLSRSFRMVVAMKADGEVDVRAYVQGLALDVAIAEADRLLDKTRLFN